MEFVTGIVGFAVGALLSWEITWRRAAGEMDRRRAILQNSARFWQAEADRAQAAAVAAEERAAAWLEGCKQGLALSRRGAK